MAPKHNLGDQWREGDLVFTVNPANDKLLHGDPDAYYVTIVNTKTKEKSTAVYRGDGTFAPVKANRDWRPVKTQRPGAGQLFVDSFRKAMRYWFGGRR